MLLFNYNLSICPIISTCIVTRKCIVSVVLQRCYTFTYIGTQNGRHGNDKKASFLLTRFLVPFMRFSVVFFWSVTRLQTAWRQTFVTTRILRDIILPIYIHFVRSRPSVLIFFSTISPHNDSIRLAFRIDQEPSIKMLSSS